MLLSAADC